ncbi:MAG: cyclase family protein [Gemmatimonadota bacterium]
MARRIFDISPPLTPSLAVFPGDTPLTREVLLDHVRGDALTLSTLRATVHLGAHVDAESHYASGGLTIDQEALDRFVGTCEVMAVEAHPGEALRPEQVRRVPRHPRVLFATGTYPDPGRFEPSFSPLDPSLIDWLADAGVRLVGVDTPSVDASDSKDLPSHLRCYARDVRILEGLVLTQVPPGEYELIAVPLRLVGFDASPVRAILRSL